MQFDRSELNDDVNKLLSSTANEICVGQNWDLEESVGEQRRKQFESCALRATQLSEVAAAHFDQYVQGARRGHLSTTFDKVLNANALMSATLEDNQKIIRLERIDQLLENDGGLTFERLLAALSPRDNDALAALTDEFQQFAGERPAFAAFKAEVDDVLKQPDWLQQVVCRLGLLHLMPQTPGEVFHFALMEYTVGDVRQQAQIQNVTSPFALATVVESRCSPAFFPAPKGAVFGFTVDLGAAGGGAQEFLHARFDYSPKHVLKLAKWQGPTDVPDVVQCRQRHVNALRLRSGRANYGEKHWPMSAK